MRYVKHGRRVIEVWFVLRYIRAISGQSVLAHIPLHLKDGYAHIRGKSSLIYGVSYNRAFSSKGSMYTIHILSRKMPISWVIIGKRL